MWKTLESNTLVDTYHVSVKKDRVQLPDGAVNMVMDGRINANSTAHLILRAARLLEKERVDIKRLK